MRAAFEKLGRICAILALAAPAAGQLPQVPLPPVQLPSLPAPREVVPGAAGALSRPLGDLAGARMLRVERLARQNRAELDRDPLGELVVRAEVVGIDMTESALRRAQAEKFRLQRRQDLPDIGLKVFVLQTPEGWSARRGLKRLRKLDPQGTYDFNHVYLDSGDVGAPVPIAARDADAATENPRDSNGRRRVGLVDGGIDTAHEIFRNTRWHTFGCSGPGVAGAHGTEVAAILVGRGTVNEIYAADVYCGQPTGGAVDAVAAALAWLARERVAVINISLVGPRNALLERVVNTLVSRGFLLVAAVGNDGPAAPPLFPASYDGVVGVTAVDRNHHVLIEACRGSQVDFAALGADVQAAATAPNGYRAVRGTSFAAPLVSALFAPDLPLPDVDARDREIAHWAALASDLGKRGRDEVYGAGELGSSSEGAVGAYK